MSAAEQTTQTARPEPRLRVRYREEIVPALVKEFGYRNVMLVGTAGKPTRAGYEVSADGKERIDRKTGGALATKGK